MSVEVISLGFIFLPEGYKEGEIDAVFDRCLVYKLSPKGVCMNKNTYGNEHQEATNRLTNRDNYPWIITTVCSDWSHLGTTSFLAVGLYPGWIRSRVLRLALMQHVANLAYSNCACAQLSVLQD